MKNTISLLSILVCCFWGCKKDTPATTTTATTTTTTGSTGTTTSTFFAKGADVSWLTQMEASNYKFYNSSGTQQDCMQLLKDKGMNAIRLRVWVNPTDGWCNTADLVVKAKRASALGMKIMIDFHYSDSWADPSKQTKPAAWVNLDFNTLITTVHDYTQSVMNTLKANNITPDWVQVGNETNDGMLWENGRASTNMANFAKLVSAGYQAVKEVSSTTQVIVHISNGYDNSLFRWMFDGLKSNGAKWDIIGMSLYPTASNWQTYNTQCLTNMNDMVSRYSTPVMICEVGFAASDATTAKAFLTDLISKTKSISNGNGLGVFYWEPEAYNWMNYGLGAFDQSGKPTVALDAFAN
ncbi:glycoside hydrolase family 53 protein [Mucilaginibacter arboris]|uniref:Arabinogalactan endo-beta-1,4-galactanase n=1 Tax=Mucilaginibacter arboris TaxID=2682090 RepID=A0A7K1SWK2_9SPHI|nr:glycosyl hydrolase 53 family protein [Mucilaginibacter arboris]MVN21440.1 cellulase family glycosylhydrolase [Mucilaginibacter arboris]